MTRSTMQAEESERLLWAVVRSIEALAVRQYRYNVPALATSERVAHLETLEAGEPAAEDDAALHASGLGPAMAMLIAEANGGDPVKTLVAQGLVLEPALQGLYRILGRIAARADARDLAAAGRRLSAKVAGEVPRMLALRVGEGEGALAVFTAASHRVLRRLEELWTSLADALGGEVGERVRDLARDFGDELVPVSASLRMDTNEVVRALAHGGRE